MHRTYGKKSAAVTTYRADFAKSYLYEASDLLLGESLYMKSVTVQYVNVYLPHQRSRKIKNYSYLTNMD